MKHIAVWAISLLFTLSANATADSNFMRLCQGGDRDAHLIAYHMSQNAPDGAVPDGYDICKFAYEVLQAGGPIEAWCVADRDNPKPCAEDMRIQSIASLKEFDNMWELDLQGNAVSDLSVVGDKPNWTGLYLDGNPIKDFEQLTRFSNLEGLGLGYNPLVTDEVVAKLINRLPNLSVLQFEKTKITHINFLKQKGTMHYLSIGYNAIEDLSPLSSLYNLDILQLNGMKIKSLNDVVNIPGISALILHDNVIENFDGVERFPELFRIELNRNRLNALQGIRNTQAAAILIKDNPISQEDCMIQLNGDERKSDICDQLK